MPRRTKEERRKALEEREHKLKTRLEELHRQKRRIDSAANKVRRRKETQAKIIWGAGAKEYLDKHPQDRWFRQFMRDYLKASDKLKTNEVLAEWAKSLAGGK